VSARAGHREIDCTPAGRRKREWRICIGSRSRSRDRTRSRSRDRTCSRSRERTRSRDRSRFRSRTCSRFRDRTCSRFRDRTCSRFHSRFRSLETKGFDTGGIHPVSVRWS
jgi:hypothetical protein